MSAKKSTLSYNRWSKTIVTIKTAKATISATRKCLEPLRRSICVPVNACDKEIALRRMDKKARLNLNIVPPFLHLIQGFAQNLIEGIEQVDPNQIPALEVVHKGLGAYKQNKLPNKSVTPKCHILSSHVVPFMRSHRFWGILSAQLIKALHRNMNEDDRRFAKIRNRKEILKKFVEQSFIQYVLFDLDIVYTAAGDLLKFLLHDFLPRHNLVESEATKLVNRTYQALINRTGDTTTDKRFTVATNSLFEGIFKGNTYLANLYMLKVLLPFDKAELVRVDQGKATIAWTGVNLLWGKSISSMTIKKVCAFAAECFQHPDSEVRKIGKNIVIYVYERGNRHEIRRILEHIFTTIHNHTLVQSLFAELSRIDQLKDAVHNLSKPNKSEVQTHEKTNSWNITSVVNPREKEFVDHTQVCLYCGYFAGQQLDKHCNEDCLLLSRCPNCEIVVETRYLRDHVLHDCKHKFHYKICERCHQPIRGSIYAKHRKENKCKMPRSQSIASRCLLCGLDVEPNNDMGWIKHLTKECLKNPRRIKE